MHAHHPCQHTNTIPGFLGSLCLTPCCTPSTACWKRIRNSHKEGALRPPCDPAPAQGASHSCLLRTLPLPPHPYQPQAHMGAQPLGALRAVRHSLHHRQPVCAVSQRMPRQPQAMASPSLCPLRAARLQAQTASAACSCGHGHAAVLDARGVGAAAAAPVVGLVLAVPALKPHHLPRGRT